MKRMMMLAALLVTACQPIPAEGGRTDLAEATPGAPTVVVQTRVDPSVAGSQDATACAAAGGKMLPQGRMQTVRCVISYVDAGQRCTDGDDCQGDCRIEDVANAPHAGAPAVGQCQVTSGHFGCYTTIEDGKAEATICVD